METLMSATQPRSLEETRPLALTPRCDRCGARAKLHAVLPGGGELLFCGHHARAHEDSLRQRAVTLRTVG
jgi:hypothetical protein